MPADATAHALGEDRGTEREVVALKAPSFTNGIPVRRLDDIGRGHASPLCRPLCSIMAETLPAMAAR